MKAKRDKLMLLVKRLFFVLTVGSFCLFPCASLNAQPHGSIEGRIILANTGEALDRAAVVIVELGRTTTTDEEGRYRFDQVPPGSYRLLVHLDSTLTEEIRSVEVKGGTVVTENFALAVAPERYELTVTASGRKETAFESFQSVTLQTSFDLADSIAPGIGEVLAGRPGNGIAARSFGPGNSRPIVRGFDGDRVLIMQDGIRTGTLSSQSGDHGELMNTAALDRVEIVKGPATLLYGSNALGGVVNGITRHHAVHVHSHAGLRGHVSATGGSANAFGGSTGGFEYGIGKWMIWGGGGGQRSGDYSTPEGKAFNSGTRVANAYGGVGWYGNRNFLGFGIHVDDGVYGVPFAEQFGAHEEESEDPKEREVERIELDSRRQSYQFNWRLRKMSSAIDNFALKLNFTQWEHDEIEIFTDGGREAGTNFNQEQFVYRGSFEQSKLGPLTGRFGFWGLARDYDVRGEEALSPPVDQNAFAVFGLEEFEFERVKLQFGGRLERTSYQPKVLVGNQRALRLPKRTFTGASAAAGVHLGLWRDGALVVNYAHSSRAPALEELYNFGPHVGTLSFEIGDPDLETEIGNGVEVSLRQRGGRARGELNFFYYNFDNFVSPFATGEVTGGLRVIQFTQLDSRFLGAEVNLDFGLHNNVWLNLGMDLVDAQETVNNNPLPRIPPLRGRVGFDFRYQGLSVRPEVILANSQHQTFSGEERTPGYTAVNLKASYTIARKRVVHQFAVNVFNIADRLYRNHTSFIKNLAPEIGRGIRFTYRIRFF